jgi:3-dehydroquinate dehydratase-2
VKALVIHGPNLNLQGIREPEIYGRETLDEINEMISSEAKELGVGVSFHQSAREGEIIELLHAGIDEGVDGALINPGAYSHTSLAISDAIRSLPFPVVEVHLSNIHAREPHRRESVTASAAAGIVAGFGPISYVAALKALHSIVEQRGS